MKTLHVVQQGEHLAQIAFRHGVTLEAIWNDPDNESLRRRRSSQGNTLAPGDVVVLPERAPSAPISIAAGQTRELVVSLPKVPIEVELPLEDGEPAADLAFRAELPGRTIHGRTNARGAVSLEVGLFVRNVRLVIEAHGNHAEHSYDLEVGGLDPLDSVTGQQQRLRQLGLYQGPLSGRLDAETRAAIERFVSTRGEGARYPQSLQDAFGC